MSEGAQHSGISERSGSFHASEQIVAPKKNALNVERRSAFVDIREMITNLLFFPARIVFEKSDGESDDDG